MAIPGTDMRRDDSNDDKIWLRSERIFYSEDGWYISTREGDLGPFRLRRSAAIELKRYLRDWQPHPSLAVSQENQGTS